MTESRREPLSGRYELQERIAVGGQGEVWRAWDPRIRRPVAVKFLHAHLVSGDGRERFMREAEALGRLRHPAVVQLYDVIETDDALALVMEFVPGAPLSDLLQPEGLEWATCVQIGTALAGALNAAHREGVIHRDLKPGNVLIEPDGAVRLTDFGLARLVGEGRLSATGAAMGTPGYWAPEQVLGLPITAQTDVYGLTALLYRAATGSEPLPRGGDESRSPFEQVMKKIRNPTELRADLPPDAVKVLLRGLEKDSRDRHPDASSLGKELASTLSAPVSVEATQLAEAPTLSRARRGSGTPTAVADQVSTQNLPPPRGRRLALLGVAAVIAVGAGAALGSVAASGGDEEEPPALGPALTSDVATVNLPAGWTPRAAVPPTGLGLSEGRSGELEGSSPAMVVGVMAPPPPRLFPAAFGARLFPNRVRPSTEDRTRLGAHPALRFRDLRIDEGTRRITLFVVPTNKGALTVACRSLDNERTIAAHRECEMAAETLKLRGGVRATGVGPDAATGRLVQSVVDDVTTERDALYGSLAATFGAGSQERLTGPAAARIEDSGKRLDAALGNDPAEAARIANLRTAILNYAGFIRRSGDAANAGDLVTRDDQAMRAGAAEARILSEVNRLRELGYAVDQG